MKLPRDRDIRYRLAGYQLTGLQKELQKVDPLRWAGMNESDKNNPRRLVRAIEVAEHKLRNPDIEKPRKQDDFGNVLIIGLTAEKKVINERIDQRVEQRMKMGMVEEVRMLLNKGYSWDLPSMSGLGYREFREMQRNGLEFVVNRWKVAEHQYAKRQLTYLKKYLPQAKWFDISSGGYGDQIRKLGHSFVK